jgi:hypothetical protein
MNPNKYDGSILGGKRDEEFSLLPKMQIKSNILSPYYII